LYFGGYFDNEEQAAIKVNLLCDKYGIERKNPTIVIDLDESVKNQTSKYNGVCWNANAKQWQVQLGHNQKQYYGGNFDNEEHAAMKVNLLCDKYGKERKNPTINIDSDLIQEIKNTTSIYIGVNWNKDCKKWLVQLKDKGKTYYGGLFDIEDHAAMKINLLCDKIKIQRKNPEINIDAIQKVKDQTSKYTGVYWNKGSKKWRAQLTHNNKQYYGGNSDNEDHAAMKVNLLCDNIEIKRKNPAVDKDAYQKETKSKIHKYETEKIVNEQVKLEDENIIGGSKDECENRLIQSNNEEKCIATEFENSNAKRKRNENSIMNDDVKKEEVENFNF